VSAREHGTYPVERPSAGRGSPPLRVPKIAEHVISLQQAAGNRATVRKLARESSPARPQLSATRHLQRLTYAEQTTVPNQALAKEIDTLALRSDAELADLEDEMWVKVSIANNPKHAEYEQRLEALEFLESQGRVQKRTHYAPSGLPRDIDERRRILRMLEANLRQYDSFDDTALEIQNWALNQPGDPAGYRFDRLYNHVEFFKKEMAEFGKDFKRQAREIALKMLAQSQSEVLDVLQSYGLRRYTAADHAKNIANGADTDKEVDDVVYHSETAWDEGPENAKPQYVSRRHRAGLGRMVKKLKEQQEIVRQALYKRTNFPQSDPAAIEAQEAKDKLAAMWLEAERQHPALAAFRGSETDLEDVKLGDLDESLHGSEPQMKALLTEILPKLGDIMKARAQIEHGTLSPLKLPPVVALTKAVMFVPEGSLRAGKVNDLVADAAKSTTAERILEAVMALIVLATLIPSGGTSVGIGIGLVSAALSTATALQDWEAYKQQKMLANTSLDRAKALSLEEPSLLPFAFDLVTLGLDGAPLLKAFHEAAGIKALVRAGEKADSKAVKALVDDLNDIGKAKGEKDLGGKALKEVEAAEKDAAAAGREGPKGEPKPEEHAPAGAKKAPEKPWKPPPGSPHPDVASLRQGIHDPLMKMNHGWTNMNSEWLDLLEVDRNALIAKYPTDKELWEKLDDAYSILRDPKKLEDGMIKVYRGAAEEGITPQEWLIKYFGGKDGMPILEDLDPKKFRDAMLKDKPALDDTLQGDAHGLLTHMFQEYVLAEEWGGRAAARDFRHAIARVDGPARGKKEMFSRVWDALFDSLDENAINRPEWLGPILHDHLKFPGRLRAL
jgi:hypothetical protein